MIKLNVCKKKVVATLMFLLLSPSAFAVEFVVSGDNVNFRATPTFRGQDNIIKKVNEGDRLVLTKEHENYIEATLVPDGTKGYIWKDYVERRNTHDYYKTKPGETFPTVTPDTEDPNISRADTLSMPICSCTSCRKSSPYGIRTHPITGRRKLHAGCDISAPLGTYVYAIADGVVKFSGWSSGYGNTIDIEHLSMLRGRKKQVISNRGYTTRYGHLWKRLVSTGQHVKRGQRVAQVDSTGLSTGNHLHFEIALTGRTLDPESVMDMSDVKKSCSTSHTEGTRTTR